jgi:hypothetical protein
VSELANRKGLLSLTPEAVEKMVLPLESAEVLPAQYGRLDEQWYRQEDYRQLKVPLHEQTLQKRMLEYLDSRMGWPLTMALVGATAAGAYQMRVNRLKRMMISNGTFCCLVLALLALAVKVRRSSRKKSIKKGGV